jgi:hypothetical protein
MAPSAQDTCKEDRENNAGGAATIFGENKFSTFAPHKPLISLVSAK